jgi:long-chain acyl-CoA synthetase
MINNVYTDILQNTLIKNSNRPCFHIKREGRYQSWTFSDFHKDLNKLCSVLKKHGLKKGTNAVVIGENSPEWVIAFHAIILTGACTIPVDPNIPPSEIESIISITEAKVVFCSKVYLNLFRALKEKYEFLERIVLLDPTSEEKEPRFEKYLAHGNEDKEAFYLQFQPDDPMVIIFTSGTTGKAKGVVLCQKNYSIVAKYGIPRMQMSHEDTVCAVLPLHHVFGFAACIAGPTLAGMDVVFVPTLKGPLILEALQDKGVTMLPAVPKMIALFYDSIMHNVKKKGPLVQSLFAGMNTLSATAGNTFGNGFRRGLFSSVHSSFGGKLRIIISGGAALNKKHWYGFRQLGFNIVEGYGLTETFGPITLVPLNDARLGSVGPILGENEVKILDPDSSGLGEVLLRGACVFKGYYKNDALTREVIDKDGWFHTGDLGYLDKDNFLFLNGRKKDVIVLDTGKNVYPDELEDYYSVSALIEEIGIFGIKNDEGEIVAAAIVPSKEVRKNNSLQKASELLYEELNRLGKTQPIHRRITDFVTVYSPLPRTTSRKLKKEELRKLFNSIKRRSSNKTLPDEQLSVLEVALMETTEYKTIVNGIMLVSPKIDIQIINPRSNLEIDLGIDSLKKIELLNFIEQSFSVTIPETIFDKMENVSDLVSLIREQKLHGIQPAVDRILSIKERILSDNVEIINFPKNSFFKRAALPLIKGYTESSNQFKFFNAENIIGLSNPLIFVANHGHILDAFWLLNSLSHKMHDNTFFIADPCVLQYPTIPYSFLKDHIVFPEPIGDPIQVLKAALSVIRNGKNLIIFPEGQISKTGIPGHFKSGIGLLARETGATVVPVFIQSTTNKSRGSFSKVIFGRSFSIQELFAKGVLEQNLSAEEITEYIRTIIISIKSDSTSTAS